MSRPVCVNHPRRPGAWLMPDGTWRCQPCRQEEAAARELPPIPRTFDLVRDVDETGCSGTGVVAQGVEFADGTAVLHWCVRISSTAVYRSMAELVEVHGHGGRTRAVFHDGAR